MDALVYQFGTTTYFVYNAYTYTLKHKLYDIINIKVA